MVTGTIGRRPDDDPTSLHDPETPEAARREIERSAARLSVLAEVSHAFAVVATDYQKLLQKIARTTADLVGDGCMVTLVDGGSETLYNAASAHRDADLESDYRAYLAGVGVAKTTSASISAGVVRTGEPKLVPEIQPGILVAQTDDALKAVVARLNVHSFVVVPIRAHGTVIGVMSLLRSGPGRSYTLDDVMLLQDMADRAGLAIENARLYDELERRVRQRTAELEVVNRELEAFSYSVAHDLRAPLRSIDGFSRALFDGHGDRLDAEGLRYLTRVRAAAKHMNQLIEGLLNLSLMARATLNLARVDVTKLAGQILRRLRDTQPDRLVEIAVAGGLWAYADPRLLEVVLTNLIGNAWKFTSKTAGARIEIGARQGDGPTIFVVRDNGAGFAPEHAQRLFGAFQRLHASTDFEGTGIGLATVQRIVHRHGGRIWAEGQVGVGATFYFTIEPPPNP